MDIDATDIVKLSDRELGQLIREITIEIAAYQGQIEPTSGPTKRTWRLLRSTILMTGGLFGATIDIWALVLAVLGLTDWIDAIAEDAAFTNRQSAIRQQLAEIEFKLALAAIELRKREKTRSDST